MATSVNSRGQPYQVRILTVPPTNSASFARAEPREIVELKRLREAQPHLASAIDFHLDLLEHQRRIRARVPLPRNYRLLPTLAERLEAGEPLLRFDEIPIDWSDARRLLRETADLLVRYNMLDKGECARVHTLTRDGDKLEPFIRWWYLSAAAPATAGDMPLERGEALDSVLMLGLRPFLARAAEALLSQIDTSRWARGRCPLCGGSPDFATWDAAGLHQLVCARCHGQWVFAEEQCPFCETTDASKRKSFVSQSLPYRVDACNGCTRYVKGFDARRSTRPPLLTLDAIATLPLDAAALQRGYTG